MTQRAIFSAGLARWLLAGGLLGAAGAGWAAPDAAAPDAAAPAAPAAPAAAEANPGAEALTPLRQMIKNFTEKRDGTKELLVYSCRNVSAAALAVLIEEFLTPGGTVAECRESDTVVVMDDATHLPALRRVMDELDQPLPQILVEARLVEFTMDSNYEKEVNVEFQSFKDVNQIQGLPDDSMSFVQRLTDSFVSTGGDLRNTQGKASLMRYDPDHQNLLSMFITFLETRGRARILSNPNLLLRRGTQGNIITGEEVPILTQTTTSGSVSTTTTFKSVGIKLRVEPTMVSGNKVRLKVSPEVSNVIRYEEKTGAPVIAVRSADTELDVLDGQMISIGGLLRSEERDVERRVPFLGSIPLLGHLFRGTERQTTRSQLVIFLAIRVVAEGDLGTAGPRPDAYPQMKKTVDEFEQKLGLPPPSLKRDLEQFEGRPPEAARPEPAP